MEIKENKPFNALIFSAQTTIPQLGEYVKHVAKGLYQEAAKLDLMVTGPIYWNYYGMDGQPDTVFTLEVTLPIEEANVQSEKFTWKRVGAFKCASQVHTGTWDDMPKTYEAIIEQVMANDLTMSDECRELYINMDFETGQNNIVEVQIGLA
jgi:effector-binding domain-containing protein